MVKKLIMFTLTVMLAVSGTSAAAAGTTGCTVKYYYTSETNPEAVPAATTGVKSGSTWKIKPAGPSRTVYTKTVNGRTMTYTFDGWYANINCKGTKYLPGKETTALVPSSSGGYSVNLYGRWIYAETAPQTGTSAAPKTGTSYAPKTESAAKKNDAPSGSNTASTPKNNTVPAAAGNDGQDQQNAKNDEVAAQPVTVRAMSNRSREEALTGWRHLLIDTFFHLNGRKYSFASPGKYWKDSSGKWSGKTGRNGNTQSCITLPTVSLKRTGILSSSSGSIWLSSNMASTPNRTVKRLKKKSAMLTIFYPHKSLKHMAAKGTVKYGDILCRSGHTFVYMGKDSSGNPLIYESGTRRDIGNGTGVTWGHHSGGHANKLTGKINKQIRKSNAIGAKWRKGQISDSAFKGHKASGKNLNKPIHIVCSINTFTVTTSCTDGKITPGSVYMAGQDVNIAYSPAEGKSIDSIKVDGKAVDKARYGSSFIFRRISSNHSISVVYK